jgi:hypothetical protein
LLDELAKRICSQSEQLRVNVAKTLALRPGQSLELLKELHILTRDGRINQDSRRKLKQVLHLVQFIETVLQEVPAQGDAPTLADHGAGKSYLGFILYDLYFKPLGRGHIWGHRNARRAGGEGAAARAAPGLRAHDIPAPECRKRPAWTCCRAHRRGDRAARLRYGNGRRDRLRPAQVGPGHGAGAVLPG